MARAEMSSKSESEVNLDSVTKILDVGADINTEVLLVTPLGAACDAQKTSPRQAAGRQRRRRQRKTMGNKQTALHLACKYVLLCAVFPGTRLCVCIPPC